MADAQDPAIDAAIVAALREYGPMTRAEIVIALDLRGSQVDTAIRRCAEIFRTNTIPPWRYAAWPTT